MRFSKSFLPAFGLVIGVTLAFACSSSSSSDNPVSTADSGSDASANEDAGLVDAGNADAAICTSGKTWKNGTSGSELMQPGNACITCHATEGPGAPTFHVAGTVYPTSHEPTLCDGKSGVTIVITDSKSNVFTLTSNSAGNFACGDTAHDGFQACSGFTPPFTAKVVTDAGTNEMTTPQTTGDCNSCHTEYGANSAPGRITLPE